MMCDIYAVLAKFTRS